MGLGFWWMEVSDFSGCRSRILPVLFSILHDAWVSENGSGRGGIWLGEAVFVIRDTWCR